MRACCPAGHGCNAPDGDEACAVELCRAAAPQLQAAALACSRWEALEASWGESSERERRFRRRAYQRARDTALVAIALRLAARSARARGHSARRRRRAPAGPAPVGRY